MLRWVFILLFFAVFLQALDDNEILKRADALMKTQKRSDEFRAYNDYKNLYLRAVMAEDDALKLSSLQGIIKSGDKLHIDVSQYSEELANLKPQPSYNKPQPKEIPSENKNIKIRPTHKLKSVRWKEEKLVLTFDKKLEPDQVNYFTIHNAQKNNYRYVFDVYGSVLSESQNLKKEGVSNIKLAQFNPKTLRLVIENNEKINLSFSKESDQLVIDIAITEKKEVMSDNKEFFMEKKEVTPEKLEIQPEAYTPKRADKNKIIMIDAGHGGEDPGAVGYKNYREKIVVLQIAEKLKNVLNARGYKVYMSRSTDVFVKLKKRTEYANKINADIFVSIHANAVRNIKLKSEANGIECYFLSPSRSARAQRIAEIENSADMSDMNAYGKQSFLSFLNNHKIIASNKLAIDLQDGMLGALKHKYQNVKDGGVREGPFWVLVGAQMPSVLVEVGFITHPTESLKIVEPEYQKDLAHGLADGIERYFAKN